MASVTLEDVSKVYADQAVALSHVDLRVADGELLSILGPSGAGKSTALRLIAGLEEPTTGRVLFDGVDMAGIAARHRNVSMVHQDGALYTHLTARENIRFPLRVRRVPKVHSEDQVVAEADHLGIRALLGKMPEQLSAGHRHAVATARALIRQSRAFLLDEPLASLDRPSRERVRLEFARLHQELGATMVYATNDQSEALALGERVAVLNEQGILEQVAEPRRLYTRPVSMFVAGFVGRMNLVASRLEWEEGWWIPLGNDRIRVDVGARPALEGYTGREVVVGIRPEHLVPALPGVPFQRCVHGRVTRVEDVGSDVHIRVEAGGLRLEARAPAGSAPAPGNLIELAADTDRLLFFDPRTGLLI